MQTDAWEPVIEKAILTETRGNEVAAKKTRERKNQIKAAVKIAIRDGMRPSDIQAVIEVMVMGMQPGDTSYLLSEEDDEDKGKLVTKIEAPPKPEKKKEKQKSPDQSFLKTSI